MTLEDLKMCLSKYGTIQICKEGLVFTLLMTGEKLDNAIRLNYIQMQVLEYAEEKYPYIEVMRNDKGYVCIVLSPKDDSTPDNPLIPLAEVRNKLTPFKNLIAIIESGQVNFDDKTKAIAVEEIAKSKINLASFSTDQF